MEEEVEGLKVVRAALVKVRVNSRRGVKVGRIQLF
jgi:hypothetical protein